MGGALGSEDDAWVTMTLIVAAMVAIGVGIVVLRIYLRGGLF